MSDKPQHVVRVSPIFVVGELARAMSYYRDVLGFEQLWAATNYAIMTRNDQQLHLQPRKDSKEGPSSCFILVKGIEAIYSEYIKNKVQIEKRLEPLETGGKRFIVRDPDDNRIIFDGI